MLVISQFPLFRHLASPSALITFTSGSFFICPVRSATVNKYFAASLTGLDHNDHNKGNLRQVGNGTDGAEACKIPRFKTKIKAYNGFY